MSDYILDPWTYAFMQRALVEVTVVGILCGIVGCFVVLRGLAFIGDRSEERRVGKECA